MKISYSRLFIKDINEIAGYIENELCNPSSARKLKVAIFSEVKRLSGSPFLGEALPPAFRIDNKDLRKLVYKNYLMIYRVDEQITIERLFLGRQDWMNILSSDNQNL